MHTELNEPQAQHYAQKIILNEDLIIKTKVVEIPKIYMKSNESNERKDKQTSIFRKCTITQ